VNRTSSELLVSCNGQLNYRLSSPSVNRYSVHRQPTTNHVSTHGIAIASVNRVTLELTLTFCMRVGHCHGSHGIEIEGHMSRSRVNIDSCKPFPWLRSSKFAGREELTLACLFI